MAESCLVSAPDSAGGSKWLRYTLGRLETDAELGSLERAYQRAAQNPGYSLREMVLSVVGSTAFRFRKASEGEPL